MSAEDELAAFQAEIAAVETAAVEDDDTGDGTPEELEFEDDDGTMYVWDRATRKCAAWLWSSPTSCVHQ